VNDSSQNSVGDGKVEGAADQPLGLGLSLTLSVTPWGSQAVAPGGGDWGGDGGGGNRVDKAILVDILGEAVEGHLDRVDQGDGASPLGGGGGGGGSGQGRESDDRLHFCC